MHDPDPAAPPPSRHWTLTLRGTLFFAAYWAAVLVTLGYAVAERARLPSWPFIDPDIWGYLNPALSRLTGGPFQHTAGRNFLYPGFVYAVLDVTGSFRALMAIQHALGVLTGVLMVWSWDRLGRLLHRDGPPPAGSRWLGLLVGAVYVTARSALQSEHTIRPEAIFPFFVLVSIALNLEFVLRRWYRAQPGAAAWLGGANLFVSVGLYQLKPSFGVTIIFANLPLALSLVRPGMTIRRKLAMTGIGAALAAGLFLWPEAILKQGDPQAETFLPTTLLTIHADLIRDQLGEDLASGQPLPYPRPLLTALHDRMAALIATSAQPENHPYRSLGFNPDYLMYTDFVYKGILPGRHVRNNPLATELDYYYYKRAALHHPGRMLHKIGRQLAIFYLPPGLSAKGMRRLRHDGVDTRDPYRGLYEVPVAHEYAMTQDQLGRPYLQPLAARYPPLRRFADAAPALVGDPATFTQPACLSGVQNLLSTFYSPILLVWLAASLGAMAMPGGARRWAGPFAMMALMYSYNFGNNLTIAIVHSLDVDRYVSNELAFTLFSAAGGLLALALMLAEAVRMIPPRFLSIATPAP